MIKVSVFAKKAILQILTIYPMEKIQRNAYLVRRQLKLIIVMIVFLKYVKVVKES
jgi:hypothetical protein